MCIRDSSNGLEARTPFLDKTFVKYYLSIPSELKVFDSKDRIEKHILRKAFDNGTYLPNDVLWRRKVSDRLQKYYSYMTI